MTPKKKDALAHDVKETGDVVVYDPQGSQLLLLNEMGAAVWLLVDGARTVAEIAKLIAGTLPSGDVSAAQVQVDVEAFVQQLEQHGLVELS